MVETPPEGEQARSGLKLFWARLRGIFKCQGILFLLVFARYPPSKRGRMRSLSIFNRDINSKGASLAGGAPHLDCPAMSHGNGAGNGEPESGASLSQGAGFGSPVEGLENPLLLVAGNADPRVRDQ